MPRRSRRTPQLLTHRSVATLMDIEASTVRKWVASGRFPEPVAVIGKTWFYDADVIHFYLKHHRWPDGVQFRGVLPRPDLSRSSAGA